MGANGKVNNMVKPYEAAKYDAIVISDSGIKSKSFSKVRLNKNKNFMCLEKSCPS